MLFNSFEFLVFLPIVFLLYWFVFRSRRWQNLLVVVASYVFYGWWDWRFLLLIAFTSLCSFGSGLLLEHYEGQRRRQQMVSAANIVLNLGILGVFKYYNFFVENLDALFSAAGWHLDWVTMEIILPVGISFYTFQALSYTIDVYQKKLPATHDIVEFFAYISFFPQLVAGPIERATNLLPQFQRNRQFNYAKAVDGCRQMLWGFLKKLVIADNCAVVVNEYWNQYAELPGLTLFLLGMLFTFQIYCDFSGYSDIAIGCARLFGFNLMRNFNYPYFSRSIPEFWRRWHISLTTWFRDYIYFPLGGSRCDKWKIIRNVYIVWGISGLWHGANWTFVCWGLFHATLLAIYNIFGINTKYQHVVAYGRYLPTIKETLQMALTFFLAIIGWIIFRAESMTQAVEYLSHMFSQFLPNSTLRVGSNSGIGVMLFQIVPAVIMLFVEWLQRNKQHALQFSTARPFNYRIVRWLMYNPRGRTVTVAYLADEPIAVTGQDDAAKAEWWPLSDLPHLAFDHYDIMQDAIRLYAQIVVTEDKVLHDHFKEQKERLHELSKQMREQCNHVQELCSNFTKKQ
ncbi:MAG: MBOAT family protein [Prevotella sp.]|nr:MBOAT family protein [Prevotella sp.]